MTSSAIIEGDGDLSQSASHALHVAVRRDQDAVSAGHRLEDEGGNRVRPLELNDFLQHRPATGRPHRPIPARSVGRIEDVHHAGQAGLGGPAARVAGGGGNRRGGAAVIRAVARRGSGPAGDGAGDSQTRSR